MSQLRVFGAFRRILDGVSGDAQGLEGLHQGLSVMVACPCGNEIFEFVFTLAAFFAGQPGELRRTHLAGEDPPEIIRSAGDGDPLIITDCRKGSVWHMRKISVADPFPGSTVDGLFQQCGSE